MPTHDQAAEIQALAPEVHDLAKFDTGKHEEAEANLSAIFLFLQGLEPRSKVATFVRQRRIIDKLISNAFAMDVHRSWRLFCRLTPLRRDRLVRGLLTLPRLAKRIESEVDMGIDGLSPEERGARESLHRALKAGLEGVTLEPIQVALDGAFLDAIRRERAALAAVLEDAERGGGSTRFDREPLV